MVYNDIVIKSFRHKGLQNFFETGSLKSIQAMHKERLNYILTLLNAMTSADDLNIPSLRFHQLKGSLKDLYSVTVQANWRITFKFSGQDVYIVDYLDYH